VPAAEALVGRLREALDPSARLGAPAHVTVLYPFVAPALIGKPALSRLRACLASAVSFAFRLERVGHFPGVVYLAPEPSEPFVALTRAVARAFPDHPPYAGRHASIVPHVTVARTDEAQLGAVAAELGAALAAGGGIRGECREVVLIENSTGRWEPRHAFALAPPPGGARGR